MHNSHTEVWVQTCDKGLFCDSGWGVDERRLLKYSCISLQLEPLSPTLPRDAVLSSAGLLCAPALAQGILPIGWNIGVSPAALTACQKSLPFLQAWQGAYTIYLSKLLCGHMARRTEWQHCFQQGCSASHSDSTGCRWCTTCRSRVLGRTCFGLSPAKWVTRNLKLLLWTQQQIYGLS